MALWITIWGRIVLVTILVPLRSATSFFFLFFFVFLRVGEPGDEIMSLGPFT